jgi:hypothetical protein
MRGWVFSFSADWMMVLENVKLRNVKMCHVMVYNGEELKHVSRNGGGTYLLQAAGIMYIMLVYGYSSFCK